MRKLVAVGAIVTAVIVATVLLISRGYARNPMEMVRKEMHDDNAPTNDSPTPRDVDYKATFSITTNGTERIFTNAMYHNLNEDVYIPSSDTSAVIVKKSGVTWSDLFESLPMSLDKECLITGTGQEFCTDESSVLRFYLNDEENPNALDVEIIEGDHLNVVYK